jgi:glutathione S-transferase
MLRLYDFELSAGCYAVRLMLSALRLTYETVAIDVYPGRENETAAFRALSPGGTLPVLMDGAATLVGARAALVHLGRVHDGGRTFLPEDATRSAAVERWLGFATGLAASLGAAREVVAMGRDADLAVARADGHRCLRELDEHLWFAERRGEPWLVAGALPTIADIACFPEVALCEEGGVSRQDYPAVRRWLDRVRRVPGFVTMPGVFAGNPAAANG